MTAGWCGLAAAVVLLAWAVWRQRITQMRRHGPVLSSTVLNPEFLNEQGAWPAFVVEMLPAGAKRLHVFAEVTAEFLAADLPPIQRTARARPCDFHLESNELIGQGSKSRRQAVFAIHPSILDCFTRGDLPASYPLLPNFVTVTLHIQS